MRLAIRPLLKTFQICVEEEANPSVEGKREMRVWMRSICCSVARRGSRTVAVFGFGCEKSSVLVGLVRGGGEG
jgi:hypothetical protein